MAVQKGQRSEIFDKRNADLGMGGTVFPEYKVHVVLAEKESSLCLSRVVSMPVWVPVPVRGAPHASKKAVLQREAVRSAHRQVISSSIAKLEQLFTILQ